MLFFFACALPEPTQHLAYQRVGEDYEVSERVLPGLQDTQRMSGDLGQIFRGGTIAIELDGTGHYDQGGDLDLRYDVQDGTAWPLDSDGLVLFSFWGHLVDVQGGLLDIGVELNDLFPLDVAFVPTLPDLFGELLPAENAAYATGVHTMVLFPEFEKEGVPLAANVGVVAHELGHGLFHERSTGSHTAAPVFSDPLSADWMYQASLHEGFADTLATLLLDDPGFIEPSLELEERRVDGEVTLDDVLLPEDWLDREVGALELYDPYALGTVVASLTWDLRLLTGDPDLLLHQALQGVEVWTQTPENPWSYVDGLVSGLEDVDGVCDAVETRLPGVDVAPCSD